MPSRVIRRVHYLGRKTKSPNGVTFYNRSKVLIDDSDDAIDDDTSTIGVDEDVPGNNNDPIDPDKPDGYDTEGAPYEDGPQTNDAASTGTDIDDNTYPASDDGDDGQYSEDNGSYDEKSVSTKEPTANDQTAGVIVEHNSETNNQIIGVVEENNSTEEDEEIAGVSEEGDDSISDLYNAPVPIGPNKQSLLGLSDPAQTPSNSEESVESSPDVGSIVIESADAYTESAKSALSKSSSSTGSQRQKEILDRYHLRGTKKARRKHAGSSYYLGNKPWQTLCQREGGGIEKVFLTR